MISKALDYTIRALFYMTARPDQEYFGVAEISEGVGVSRTYLGKILQRLTRADFLKSTTGPGGGFALARPPEHITLYALLEISDEYDNLKEKCFLGLAECSERNPCPIHHTWKGCREDLLESFRTTTIAEAQKTSWPRFQAAITKNKSRRNTR